MSTQKGIVEIVASEYAYHKETFHFGGYQCPRCGGRGGHREQVGHDEWKSEECGYCQGTGKVKAIVEVKWTPDLD